MTMETNNFTSNLGSDPQKDQKPVDLSVSPSTSPAPAPVNNTTPAPLTPAKPGNPSDISINFKPVIPGQDKKPEVVTMEIKREDLKKMDAAAPVIAPATEKKGLFGGLFGKKESVPASKPSSAWGNALDVSKDAVKPAAMNIGAPAPLSPTPAVKPVGFNISAAPTPAPLNTSVAAGEKPDFFSSSALKDKAGDSNKLIENIASQKAKLEQPKMEDLLGKKSTILEKSIEEETQLNLKKKLRLVQFLAFFVTVVTLGVNAFLYYQLSPGINLFGFVNYNFENNLRNDLFNLNTSLRSVQTDLNKNRYLSGQLYLNQFGYESTRFMDGVAELANPQAGADTAAIQSVVAEAKLHMPDLLKGAKDNLTQPIVVATYKTRGEEQLDESQEVTNFQFDLRNSIIADKQAFKNSSDPNNIDALAQDLKVFDNTAKLVGNVKLMESLKASTIEAFQTGADTYENDGDAAQKASFKQYIDDLLASTKVNLATITDLRNNRIAWSDVLDRVQQITNDVNTTNNSGQGSGDNSVITYSGFDLNSDTGKITVNGENKTSTGTNRQVVTALIESLESSAEFKNVTNRSFPVSRNTDASGNKVFTMNFKMELEIEKGKFSKLNTPVADLNGKTVAFTKVPVKK